MGWLTRTLLLVDGRISKTKLVGLVGAFLVALKAFKVIEVTEEQRHALEVLLVSLGLIFLRDGMES